MLKRDFPVHTEKKKLKYLYTVCSTMKITRNISNAWIFLKNFNLFRSHVYRKTNINRIPLYELRSELNWIFFFLTTLNCSVFLIFSSFFNDKFTTYGNYFEKNKIFNEYPIQIFGNFVIPSKIFLEIIALFFCFNYKKKILLTYNIILLIF